jgi:hypothetical protein
MWPKSTCTFHSWLRVRRGSCNFRRSTLLGLECYVPSTAERWVWRAVAVFSIGLPLLWGTTQILGRVYKRDHRRLTAAGKPRVHRTLYSYISHTGLLLYIAGRLFVIVEAIRCLFYLPPEAFVTTWPTNLPQIS